MKSFGLVSIASVIMLSILLASMVIAPIGAADTSVTTQVTVTIEQLRSEATLLKIMIERAISVYVVPPQLMEQAQKLIKANISAMTASELENYISSCTALLNEIKNAGRPVNAENTTIVARSIAVEVAKRVSVLSKALNITMNVSIVKMLSKCHSMKEMKKALMSIEIELVPLLVAHEASKIVSIINSTIPANVTGINVTKIERKLIDALKMLRILNRTILMLNKSVMMHMHMHLKQLMKKIMNSIMSEAKHLEQIMKMIEKSKSARHHEHEKHKHGKAAEKLSSELLKKLSYELNTTIRKLEKALKNVKNASIKSKIYKMLEILLNDSKMLKEIISGKMPTEKAVAIVKKIAADIAEAKSLLVEITVEHQIQVSVKHIKETINSTFHNITIVIEHLKTVINEMMKVGKEINMTVVVSTATNISRELDKLAAKANQCMSLSNDTEKLRCLMNVSRELNSITIELASNLNTMFVNVSTELTKMMSKLAKWQNVTKEANSYLNKTVSKWLNELKNMTVLMNSSIAALMNSSSINMNITMKIIDNELNALEKIEKIAIVIPVVRQYVNVSISIEMVTKMLNNITKMLPKHVSTIVKNLIKKIKEVINESLKYLLCAVQQIEKNNIKQCKKYLANIEYLLKIVKGFLKELEELISSQQGGQTTTTTTTSSTSTTTRTRGHG